MDRDRGVRPARESIRWLASGNVRPHRGEGGDDDRLVMYASWQRTAATVLPVQLLLLAVFTVMWFRLLRRVHLRLKGVYLLMVCYNDNKWDHILRLKRLYLVLPCYNGNKENHILIFKVYKYAYRLHNRFLC